MSAISASRGAPRMPLPIRSMKRAATSQPTVVASGKIGLVTRGKAVAERGEELALAQPIGERAGEDLGDRGGRLGNPFDDADGQRRGAENADEIDRQKRVDRLRRGVHQQGHQAEHPDARRDRAKTGNRSWLPSLWPLPSSRRAGQRKNPPAGGALMQTPAAAGPRTGPSRQESSAFRRFWGTPSPSPCTLRRTGGNGQPVALRRCRGRDARQSVTRCYEAAATPTRRMTNVETRTVEPTRTECASIGGSMSTIPISASAICRS